MSLQQELRYIEALSAIVETLEAGESALDVVTEAEGASAGRVSTV